MEEDSFAVKIPTGAEKIHYAIFPKNIDYQTSDAHSEVVKSPFYDSWLDRKYRRINEIIDEDFDIEDLMRRAMEDMFDLNSVLISRGNVIQTPESIALMKNFIKFSKKNAGIYITGDTGPSLMVMSSDKSLLNEFLASVDDPRIIGSHYPTEHKQREMEFYNESKEFLESL